MKTLLQYSLRNTFLFYFFPVLLIVTLLSPTQAFSQDVREEWVQRYSGSLPVDETSIKMVFDETGNVYLTGNSLSSSLHKSIVVVKYSPTGEQLWVHRFGAGVRDEVTDIEVSKAGEVFIIGESDPLDSRTTVLLLKLDSETGQRIWFKQLRVGTYTYARRLWLDEMGGVYIYGLVNDMHSVPSSYNFLYKYSTKTGNFIWGENFTKTSVFTSFTSLAFDNTGDVYITGSRNIPSATSNIHLVKFEGTAGTILWEQSYDSGSNDHITGLVVNNSGGVFISGYSEGVAAEFLLKYSSSDGEKIWGKLMFYSNTPIHSINNLTVDYTGGVFSGGTVDDANYVIRYSTETGNVEWLTPFEGTIEKIVTDNADGVYAPGSGATADYLISKYDAVTGKLLWQQSSENGNNSHNDELLDIRISNSGIHIAGLNSTENTIAKLFVAKHQTIDGAKLWKSRIQILYTGDEPAGVATDKEGNIYVAGRNRLIAPNSDVPEIYRTIIKYSATGEELWVVKHPISPDFPEVPHDFVLDNSGGVYLVGTIFSGISGKDSFFTTKYSAADGSEIWEKVYNEEGYSAGNASIAADNVGGIYISGTNDLNGNQFITTIKYNAATGTQEWVAENEKGSAADIAVKNGFVYVAGTAYDIPADPSQFDQDFLILKYNTSDGALDWKSSYDSGSTDISRKMVLDENNGVYVIGPSGASAGTVKFSSLTGEKIWVAQDTEPVYEVAIAADNNGGIYITGSGGGNFVTAKYDASDGSQLWQSAYDVAFRAIGRDIIVDNLGGVYAVGTVVQTVVGAESFVTIKYNASDGKPVWTIAKPVGPNDLASVIALDKDLNVIISGSTRVPDSFNPDILTIKYSQQGDLPCFSPLSVQLSLPPHAVHVGEQVRTTADFGDYVPGEAHNIRWAWGDESQPTIAYFSAGDSHITGEHTYTSAGIYRVSLDFSQSCLVPESYDFEEWLVIYDPAAGSVTGGGQLLSLQTQLPWMSQQQNAQFSFNVRYNQGSDTTPQGQTQLNLRDQGVFRSNTIDWLVVRGNQALWQGTGTLNGQGNYGFTASVWDGRGTGADDTGDEIRIRIWDKNAGNAIVYDNFETAGDIYDMTNPTSRIVLGQIIIHPLATASKIASKQETLYNYPNTFRDKTTITFTADKAGDYRLEVYDMRGKLVKQLWQGETEEGQSYSVELDGTAWPKGIYVARLVSGTGAQTIKMLLER